MATLTAQTLTSVFENIEPRKVKVIEAHITDEALEAFEALLKYPDELIRDLRPRRIPQIREFLSHLVEKGERGKSALTDFLATPKVICALMSNVYDKESILDSNDQPIIDMEQFTKLVSQLSVAQQIRILTTQNALPRLTSMARGHEAYRSFLGKIIQAIPAEQRGKVLQIKASEFIFAQAIPRNFKVCDKVINGENFQALLKGLSPQETIEILSRPDVSCDVSESAAGFNFIIKTLRDLPTDEDQLNFLVAKKDDSMWEKTVLYHLIDNAAKDITQSTRHAKRGFNKGFNYDGLIAIVSSFSAEQKQAVLEACYWARYTGREDSYSSVPGCYSFALGILRETVNGGINPAMLRTTKWNAAGPTCK